MHSISRKSKVYFGEPESIACMNLDCTGKETILKGVSTYRIVFFNKKLYYFDANGGALYSLVSGGGPQLVDGSKQMAYLCCRERRFSSVLRSVITDFSKVSLYVASGAAAKNGKKLTQCSGVQ